MKRKLSVSNIKVLESLTNTPKDILQQLHNLGLIDTSSALNMIIKNEYQALIQGKACLKKDAVMILSGKYEMSKSCVEIIIYKKEINKKRRCASCHKMVSKYKYQKNKGLCDECNSLKQ